MGTAHGRATLTPHSPLHALTLGHLQAHVACTHQLFGARKQEQAHAQGRRARERGVSRARERVVGADAGPPGAQVLVVGMARRW